MNKHKHAELIKAWADGSEIEVLEIPALDKWSVCPNPSWRIDHKYRIKPEKKYPKTFKNEKWFCDFIHSGKSRYDTTYVAIANEAIKHSIIDGQVIIANQEKRDNGRDIAVANAVLDAIEISLPKTFKIDLNDIVSKVK